MKELTKTQNTIFRTGAVLMLVEAATYLFGGVWSNALYVVGVLMFVSMQLKAEYEGRNFTIIRLRRQQLMGSAAFVLSAAAQTAQTMGHYLVRYNEWVVCLLIGAILEFYTALRIPQELEKEKV